MINKLSEENKNEFEWEDYVLDFEIEILSLPNDIGIGSRAYVRENFLPHLPEPKATFL